MDFIKTVELAIQKNNFAHLKHLLRYWGQTIRVTKMKEDEYSDVYGRQSGKMQETYAEICALVVNSDVVPLGPSTAGAFDVGQLYTDDATEVQIGMIVEIKSIDGKARRYVIKKKESYGLTTSVFFRYEILAIAD